MADNSEVEIKLEYPDVDLEYISDNSETPNQVKEDVTVMKTEVNDGICEIEEFQVVDNVQIEWYTFDSYAFGVEAEKNNLSPEIKIELLENNNNNNDIEFETKCFEEKCFGEHLTAKEESKEHITKRFKCGQCDYSTSKKFNLDKHVPLHFERKPFECETCKQSFKTKYLLRDHIHDKDKQKCPHCDNTFNSAMTLRRHLNEKHLICNEYKCNHCAFSTTRKFNLKVHIMCKHSNNEKLYNCKHCKYCTNRKNHFDEHVRIHTKEKPFKCNYENCVKRFARAHHLTSHIKHRHTLVKDVKCDRCDYVCVSKSNLRQHVQFNHS